MSELPITVHRLPPPFTPTRIEAGTETIAARARDLFPGVPVAVNAALGESGWRMFSEQFPEGLRMRETTEP